MAQIPLTTAYLLGLVLETLSYGMYIVLFLFSMYFLVGDGSRKRRGSRMAKSMLFIIIGNVILFATITAGWIIVNIRSFTGFIGHSGDSNWTLMYFASFSGGTTVAIVALYLVETAVADSIMVYRLWIVWQHKRSIMALPGCTYLATLVGGANVIYRMRKLTPNEDFFESPCALTRYQHEYILLGIIVVQDLDSFGGYHLAIQVLNLTSVLQRSVAVFVESALLLTTSSAVLAITYFTHSFALFPCMGIAAPLIGFAYCLIIVRFGLRGAFKADSPTLSSKKIPPLQPSYSNPVAKSAAIDAMHESETVMMGGIEPDAAKTSQTDAVLEWLQTYSPSHV
ncbi:uncharacterized protein PHACADRAFT_189474 [Phanerochaete carnosa HHB-10118-sp]|uniref:Uncharacterized protein n=1 Tax=Phanerochaete carnosa (strain HHB-10118-sp) TaxID=650164 RepID=K5W8U7_PHACS|nr:uncharacterized protein PHACADRAFT_189474 [Phanerochaete carnosa HHB-10118-sp]EKM60338.1 hypothetical protein PHACADRAFT_189474 [Phanerochaete carnosa HHB-10118-sp]